MSVHPGGPIRVLVVDDCTLRRDALCVLLARETGVSVIGCVARDGVVSMHARACGPDIVLLDVGKKTAAEVRAAVTRLRSTCPAVRVVATSGPADRAHARTIRASGVDACLSGATYDTLVRLIRSTAAAVAPAPTAPTAQQGADCPPGRNVGPVELLTSREAEVMAHVARALSNRQIGNLLGITEDTVKRHLRNAFRKLNAGSRIEAVNRLYGGTREPGSPAVASQQPGGGHFGRRGPGDRTSRRVLVSGGPPVSPGPGMPRALLAPRG